MRKQFNQHPFQTRFDVCWPDGRMESFKTEQERLDFILRGERRGEFVACAYSPEDEVVEVVARYRGDDGG